MHRIDTNFPAPRAAHSHRDWGQSLWLVLAPVLARLTLAMLLATLALSLFIKIAHGVMRGSTRQFDAGAIAFFQAHQVPLFHTLMNWVSVLAGPIFVPLLVLAVLVWHARAGRFWPDGWTMLIASAGGQAFVVGLKLLFHRPRPLAIYSYLSYSFPSSHSFMALTIYGLLAYWLTRDAPRQRAITTWALATL